MKSYNIYLDNYLKEFKLDESYYDTLSIKDIWSNERYTIEIFKNPSKFEIDKLNKTSNGVRFLITRNGDLYVWFGLILHDQILYNSNIKNVIFTFALSFNEFEKDSLMDIDKNIKKEYLPIIKNQLMNLKKMYPNSIWRRLSFADRSMEVIKDITKIIKKIWRQNEI